MIARFVRWFQHRFGLEAEVTALAIKADQIRLAHILDEWEALSGASIRPKDHSHD